MRLAPDGRIYCFEVNPCPAFSYYEESTGQPIARALAEYLTGDPVESADPRSVHDEHEVSGGSRVAR